MGFHYLRKGIALFSLLLMSFSLFASVMTPYVEKVDPEEFYNGATFDIGPGNFNNEEFSKEIEKANSLYNINTVTIYGFEGLSQSSQQYIFSELSRLGMKIVIRIESYPQDFSFSEADAKAVVSSYSALIDFCSDENRRDTVAYFALNMPVDDIAVQRNAGGLNTRAWIDAQKSYASAFVRLMREECARNGWDDAKMYLSVFYGWDNTFKTPSYKDAGADGYFINNYTYPDSSSLSSSDPLEIINAKRLAVSMKTYEKQYGDAPVVMEWGFHTIDFNGGIQPNQTAGLVKNLYAKEIAMKATLDFYKENYPQVRGCLYFGYNLLKEEGNPPALLDWCLVYPLMEGWNDAVNALASEGVIFSEDGWVFLSDEGSSLEFDNCPELQMISVYYRSDVDSTVKIYSDGRSRGTFSIPASKEDAIIGIPLIGSEDASLKMELQDGSIFIKSVFLSSVLEAEYALGAKIKEDGAASNGYGASLINGPDNAVAFPRVRGGEKLSLTYKTESETAVTLMLDGKRAAFNVDSTNGEYKTITVTIPVYRNADISVYADNDDFILDFMKFSGIPATR